LIEQIDRQTAATAKQARSAKMTNVLFHPLRQSVKFPLQNIRTISSRAIVFPTTGNPREVLSLHPYDVPDTPSPDSILVKFLAAPINPADLNQIEGVYPSKAKFQALSGKQGEWAIGGNEGVVKILKVGDSVKSEGIESGRWAIMKQTAFGENDKGQLAYVGTWRTYAETGPDALLPLPKEAKISPVEAATISVNPFTADRMILDYVKLENGDWIVQNGANSGVGQNVIQLARIRGFKTVNIVRDRYSLLGPS
jgi:mitochondrial enoyl-[acyl-carrier protein] reductase / trans-2-enoyl-CoA reductase